MFQGSRLSRQAGLGPSLPVSPLALRQVRAYSESHKETHFPDRTESGLVLPGCLGSRTIRQEVVALPSERPRASLPTRAAVTIRDVARLAGVSVGTASKALNNQGQLRPETRAKIMAASEQLGYHPNDLMLSLRRGRSYTVGLISTDNYGRFSMPLVEGIEDALGEAQFNVFLCNAADDPERERRHIHSLLSKRVDGIIVTARRTDPRPPLDLGGADVPVIYAYTQTTGERAVSLLPDDEGGGRLATEHLLGLGHTRIGHVTGPERFLAVRERLQGVRAAMRAHELEWPDAHVMSGPWSEAWGYAAADRVLHLGVSAVFCGNDQIARGLIDRLRERGVRVPGDLAVVGFDNWEVVAAATRPPLTTVDMNLHDLGRQAAGRLLSLIDGPPPAASTPERLPCRLVVRESCGAGPAPPGRGEVSGPG